MKVEGNIALLTPKEYKEMMMSVLDGSDHVMNNSYKSKGGGVEKTEWGFKLDRPSNSSFTKWKSPEVQDRLERLLDDQNGSLSDVLYERLGEEACTYESKSLSTDDVDCARTQGIAMGLRMAQAMVHEEAE